ncbi:hypothetical protein BGZ98_004394 [Dissophora globulifera]|nr:hypothetical protein BGZ98_004394 [Dissophora globulifera]
MAPTSADAHAPAATAAANSSSTAQPATKQGPSKRRGSKAPKAAIQLDASSAAAGSSQSSAPSPAAAADQSPAKLDDGVKKNGRQTGRRSSKSKGSNNSSSTPAAPAAMTKDSAEPISNGPPAASTATSATSSSTLTPQHSEKLSPAANRNNTNSNRNNNNINNNNGVGTTTSNNDRKKSTSSNNHGKKKSTSASEPAAAVSSAADLDAGAAVDINSSRRGKDKASAVPNGPSKKSSAPKDSATTPTATLTTSGGHPKRSNNSRGQAGSNSTDARHANKSGSKDKAKGRKDKEQDKSKDVENGDGKVVGSSSSKDVRPSSISSSCSFLTSSSSLSPTSPTSPSSLSSSPSSPLTLSASTAFAPPSVASVLTTTTTEATPAVAAANGNNARRGGRFGRSGANENLPAISTVVSRDSASSLSAPLSGPMGSFSQPSPLSFASPLSRRSSALLPNDKFGRPGGGLPTVDEGASDERQTERTLTSPFGNGQPSAGGAKRGHNRSLSMKEQLDQLTVEKGGKSMESLHSIINIIKSLPPNQATAGAGASSEQVPSPVVSRHEKRMSFSAPSRNSIGPLSSGATSTTLHISQPPPGTSIENALQTTVATLRRLSITESKRPLVPGEPTTGTNENRGSRRSVVFSKDMSHGASESFASGYQPHRRSVIVKPEEVAALQEGRSFPPAAFSFASDDESDAVADALSALEGKTTPSNRSSYSTKRLSQQRTSFNVDPSSLAEFAAKLPKHLKGMSAAALVNNDDAQDRRRFTTAFHSTAHSHNRNSVIASAGTAGSANRRLSTISSTKDQERMDWRMSTPSHGHSYRDSVSFNESANGRRALFTAHLTYSDFHTLHTKQKHKYVQGVLRINKRNRSDAYVTVDSLPEGDVYICGSKDRNRALEGDVVGIELIDAEELPFQKLDGSKDKDKKNIKRTEEPDGVGEADVDENKPEYYGRVVSIVERSLSQMFSGTLTLQRPSGSAKKSERKKFDDDDQKDQPRIVWFKPTDKRVPLIAIPIDQVPADFVENHSAYTHKLFIATIKRWPLSSLHPFGQLERELGDIGNIEIETEALLADNNVTTTAFGEKVEKCLPELPWAIPEKELSKRRDLRKECVFTIDPATAKDLDDAVSCIRLEDGTLEIGVHIADVSHFIKAGSALDREAKSRATTVYLVQKAIPMLPTILSEDLCSLTSDEDRLTFSVFWKMTEDGEILDTTFSKSIIRSCAQLSYDDAQTVITTGSLDPKVEVHGQQRTLVEENIKIFFKLSQGLRQRRFENGALSINSIKLSFATDDLHNPLDVSAYELKESNRLIEEFMLLANMSVAKQICEFFPDQALLRRHAYPLEKRMADFISHMNKVGLNLDASSSGALQRSLDAIQDPHVRDVVRLLAIKPMQKAKYICSGMLTPDKYHHYALHAPLYTHFTSPIRRYADIIVHRMLEASLTGDTKFYMTKEACQKSANHCNIKKDAAKLAQEQSSHVYLSVLLKNLTESKGRVVKDAVVVKVLDSAFDVLVPEYGLEKRVYVDQLPVVRHTWKASTEMLKLYWGTEAFKTVVAEEEAQDAKADEKKRRLSAFGAAAQVGAMDHPDDATNAYEDERGLFDDESDFEDTEDSFGSQIDGHAAEAEEDEDVGEDAALRLTRVQIFGHVRVLITVDTTVSPPVIKVIATNPYAADAAASPVAVA